ncbi:calcium-binding protein [Streptomyces decoyicus]|uniref:calcium-binding protein n=1 Tax=Streptomyces decoyicus TaxID=249567 RepID=UPI0033AC8D49
MRKRAISAVLGAAVALGGSTAVAYGDETVGDVQIATAAVSGGKDIAIGLAGKTVTVSVTATDPSGIWDADFHLWRGTDPDNPDGYLKPNDDSRAVRDASTTVRLQRLSKLTVNASPEPIAAGKPLTVTGRLTRANWDTDTYYTAQPVKLQFRKAGTSTYNTSQTVNTSSTGDLKAAATASVDGYWRWNFAGTSTTPAVKATGDYVDVQ